MEESRKRSHPGDSDAADDGDSRWNKSMRGKEPLLKLLVPGTIAGLIIGKGGERLKELKTKYGGHIRLSNHKEYYPGTEERICILTGKMEEIIDLNNYILEKTSGDVDGRRRDSSRGDKTKIVLTNNGAGMVIGKKGATTKQIQEECDVNLVVADSVALNERVLTIKGQLANRKQACRRIIEKIADEETNMGNLKARYDGPISDDRGGDHRRSRYDLSPADDRSVTSSWGGGGRSGGHMGGDSFSDSRRQPIVSMIENVAAALDKQQILQALTGVMQGDQRGGGGGGKHRSNKLKSELELKLEVPNNLVGQLMGKHGQTIKEMVRKSHGASFAFTDKDRYDTSGVRTLTIKGSYEQVTSAYDIVHDEIEDYQQFDMYQQNY